MFVPSLSWQLDRQFLCKIWTKIIPVFLTCISLRVIQLNTQLAREQTDLAQAQPTAVVHVHFIKQLTSNRALFLLHDTRPFVSTFPMFVPSLSW